MDLQLLVVPQTLVGAYTGTLKRYVTVANIRVEGPDGPATLPAAHRVWIAPGELPAGIDMILGDPYLAMNQAVIDCDVRLLFVTLGH